jgi:starch synthase
MPDQPLKILFVSAEVVPFAKVGGLADVASALPKALHRLGHDVRVAMPRYGRIDPARFGLKTLIPDLVLPMDAATEHVAIQETRIGDELPIYMVDSARYFNRENIYGYNDDGERFILFCRAILEMVKALDWAPDIIHCNDWHTAIIPNWLATIYRNEPLFGNTATVYTIHNLAYQGIFGYRILEIAGVAEQGFLYPAIAELADVVDLMGRGILFADVITTVSPRYAQEILTPPYGERLDHLLRERQSRLFGILNGIDVDELDPASDRYIHTSFDIECLDRRIENKRALQEQMHLTVDPAVPLVGMISRLTDQKGFDLLAAILQPLMEQGIQFVLLGTGDQHYHEVFQNLAARYPRQASVSLTFNAELAQRIYAGCDIFLMPSRFEPCGLGQMIAMRYGAIPVVRSTGGLADTVREYDPAADSGEGFAFASYDPWALFAAIVRAMEVYRFKDVWRRLMERDMLIDHSWAASAERYVAIYGKALMFHRSGSRA